MTRKKPIFSENIAQIAQIDTKRDGSGGGRDRTGNLLVANQALSQLSYTPGRACPADFRLKNPLARLTGPKGSGRIWIRTRDLSLIRAAL